MATYFVKSRCSCPAGSFFFQRLLTTIPVRKTFVIMTVVLWHAIISHDVAVTNLCQGSTQQSTGTFHVKQADDNAEPSVAQLITQLGDPHYLVRDEAGTKLIKIGGPAIPDLRNATGHHDGNQPDSEIRLRATRLLILIERKERDRKIREFLEGGDDIVDLSGWTEFSNVVGTDRISRKLFVDMHQAQPDLLATISKDKTSVEEAYQDVCRRSLRSNGNSNAAQSIGTLTAMLFVSTLEFPSDQNHTPKNISVSVSDLRRIQRILTQTQVFTFVNNSGNRSQIGRLISNWLATLPDDENDAIIIQLSVISTYQIIDQLELVTKFARNHQLPPPTRITAIDVFGSLATKDDAGKLGPLMDDKTVIGHYLPRTDPGPDDQEKPALNSKRPKLMQVQIRDLALATSLKLHQLDLADFGFDSRCFSSGKLIQNYAGFLSDEDRKSAFDKWEKPRTLD